jgi:DNA replication protein DnaC
MDRPAFKPFPETRYVFAEWRKVTANIDYHIAVDHNLYSVPHSLIGHELDVRLTARTVEVSGCGHRVAVHQRAFGRGRVTTEPSHRPASHQRHLEWTPQRMIRQNRRLTRLLKAAKLRLPACVEDINYRQPRSLDRNLVVHPATCDWIGGSQNVLITGRTGVGKTFIACALAHSSCRHGFSARYYRVPRLLSELAVAHGDGSYPKMLVRLSKIRLLFLDDWGTAPLSPVESRDILEIIDDRIQLSSTIIASQLPVEDWHASIIDPSVADAVLDRLVHNSHRIHLKGESMRKAEQRS